MIFVRILFTKFFYVSAQKLHSILSGILHGLNTLHDSGLIHGAVHPNNIFVSPDNVGVLAEFDFSKTLVCFILLVSHLCLANNGYIYSQI